MGNQEKIHEKESEARVTRFQERLNTHDKDDPDLKVLNARVDTQLKIEDLMIRWREANHAKFKVWAPTIISIMVAVAGFGAGYQGYVTHELEKKKAAADIVLKAVGATPQDTLANLEALRGAGLLEMSREEIKKLASLKAAPSK